MERKYCLDFHDAIEIYVGKTTLMLIRKLEHLLVRAVLPLNILTTLTSTVVQAWLVYEQPIIVMLDNSVRFISKILTEISLDKNTEIEIVESVN